MNNFKYIPSFDGIRAYAVILVLLIHSSYGFFKGGWIGVDLFFALSGYLITSLLQQEYTTTGKISLKNFYIRRGLRLVAPLIICVIISNILWNFINKNSGIDRIFATLASLFYFSNLIQGNILGPLAQLWSLSVEEHFYLVWPIVFYKYLLNKSAQKQLIFVITTVVASALLRVYVYNIGNQIIYAPFVIDAYRFTFCRLDTILMGVALAIFLKNFNFSIKIKINKLYFIVTFCIVIIYILLQISDTNMLLINGGFIITNIICLSIIFFAIAFPNQYMLSNSIVTWIGRRSYGLYMYHFPIFLALEHFRQNHSLNNFILITFFRIIITVLITELSFRYVEYPILKLKHRYKSGHNFDKINIINNEKIVKI